MRIIGLIWLGDIVEKLADKHGVEQREVKEILEHRPAEHVYAALGQTAAGRYLVVFFVHKKDGRALILSARDMSRMERRMYEQK